MVSSLLDDLLVNDDDTLGRKKLFVVMLGGKHSKAKVEVHDVAFVVAPSLEDTYPVLRASWFGCPKGLHIDAWMVVDGVEQWRVEFSPQAPRAGLPKLYFINSGGYDNRVFGEAHQYPLLVAQDKKGCTQPRAPADAGILEDGAYRRCDGY